MMVTAKQKRTVYPLLALVVPLMFYIAIKLLSG